MVSKHKFIELDIFYSARTIIELEFDCDVTGHDHAGIGVEFGLLGLCFIFGLRDTRHWDYDKNMWEPSHE